jgi:hypothetical protein
MRINTHNTFYLNPEIWAPIPQVFFRLFGKHFFLREVEFLRLFVDYYLTVLLFVVRLVIIQWETTSFHAHFILLRNTVLNILVRCKIIQLRPTWQKHQLIPDFLILDCFGQFWGSVYWLLLLLLQCLRRDTVKLSLFSCFSIKGLLKEVSKHRHFCCLTEFC